MKNWRITLFTKKLVLNPLFSGSAIMIFGSNFANAIAYLYHLVVGRILGPSLYGELSSVISLLGLIFAAFGFLGLVIVKFISSADEKNISSIYFWFIDKAIKIGILLSAILLVLTPFLSNFLHIEKSIILLLVPLMFIAVISFVLRSYLQGLMKFTQVVIANNLDLGLRLLLGITFIYLGLKVFGAVLGLVVSMIISLIYLKINSSKLVKVKNVRPFKASNEVFKFAIPVFITSIATNSIFSTDVLLVKHYFSAYDAGIYSSLSTLGRIIFYGAGPISAVMFPMVSKKYSEKNDYSKIFKLSFLLTSALVFGVVFVYWVAPELTVKVLYGEKYLEAAKLLVNFALFMALFTLSSLLINFFLSIEKYKAIYIVTISAILQIIGISIIHDSLDSVILVSISVSFIMLVGLLILLNYELRKTRISR